MRASLHKCETESCDCNATGVFRFCKFCRHKLKERGVCAQCAENSPHGKSMYCLECKNKIGKHQGEVSIRLRKEEVEREKELMEPGGPLHKKNLKSPTGRLKKNR